MPPGKVYWQRRMKTLLNSIEQMKNSTNLTSASIAFSYIELARISHYIFEEMDNSLEYHEKSIDYLKSAIKEYTISSASRFKDENTHKFYILNKEILYGHQIAIQLWRVKQEEEMKHYFELIREKRIQQYNYPIALNLKRGAYGGVAFCSIFLKEYSTAENAFLINVTETNEEYDLIRKANVNNIGEHFKNPDPKDSPMYNIIQYGLTNDSDNLKKALKKLEKETRSHRVKNLHYDFGSDHMYELCLRLKTEAEG